MRMYTTLSAHAHMLACMGTTRTRAVELLCVSGHRLPRAANGVQGYLPEVPVRRPSVAHHMRLEALGALFVAVGRGYT